jgi:transcription antitermination factor NusG
MNPGVSSLLGTFVAVAHLIAKIVPGREKLGEQMTANMTTAWYALEVWARKENSVASHLDRQGFETFLPKYTSVRQWSDRKKEVEQPLFPGYLFCRFDFEQRRPIVVTPGVLQVVGNRHMAIPVADREIEALQTAVASGLPTQPWPYLEIGERVRINSGKLTGLEGVLINFKGNHRVVLSVSLLQRSVALEVDLAWLESSEKRRTTEPGRALVAAPIRVVG